jgi:hypothetical protein
VTTNNNSKTGNGRVPVIGPGVRHPVPIALDPVAWRGGQVVGVDDRVYFSDGTEWRGIPFADEARSLTEAPALVTVGPGGEFGSLNAAFTYLARFSPPRTNFTLAVSTEVRLLTGYAPVDPLFIAGFDFNWLRITAEDSEILVPVSACGDPANAVTPNTRFFMTFGGAAPQFDGVRFTLDHTWSGVDTAISGVDYIGARFSESASLLRSGFRNFTDNIRASGGSSVDIVWSTHNTLARRYGVEVIQNGSATIRGSTIRGASRSVFVRNGGLFTVRQVAGDDGAGGITISDLRRTAGTDSSSDVFVADGGVAQLGAGTLGGANIPFNVPTSSGLVYKATSTPSVWPGILKPESYTVATVPSAAAFPAHAIHVSNGNSGAPCLAVSNGTDWLRIALGAAVST